MTLEGILVGAGSFVAGLTIFVGGLIELAGALRELLLLLEEILRIVNRWNHQGWWAQQWYWVTEVRGITKPGWSVQEKQGRICGVYWGAVIRVHRIRIHQGYNK
jgi:hypothetical protein